MNTSSSKKIWSLLIIFFIILVSVLIIIDKKSTSSKLKKITIAQTSDFFLYAPIYVAIDQGYFKNNGLDVSLVSTGGDEKTWAAVLSGNADFGVSDPTFIAISDAKGIQGRVIASIVNGVPFWGITFNPKINNFNTAKDINNYSVGTFPSPSTAYTLQKKMFIDAGIKPNIHEGAFGTILAMLHSNQIDIGLELEPNVSQAVLQGAKVVYSLANLYGDFSITGLTATPEFLIKNPDVAKKTVCAIQQSLQFIHNNPDSTTSILIKRFPEISNQAAKQALSRVVTDQIIPSDAIIKNEAWEKAISLRQDVGDIKNPKDMSAYVDNSFAILAKKDCTIK